MEKIASWFMEVGWKLREGQKMGPHWLQFGISPVFLLFSAMIFGLEKDYYGFSESLDHMVYWLKLASKGLMILAARLGNHALDIMNHHRPEKRASALRAMISVYMDMGNYAYTLNLIDVYLAEQSSVPDRADILSLKASCLLALGLTSQARDVINDVVTSLETVDNHTRDYVWAVWFSRALVTKSKCLFAQYQPALAKDFAELALYFAELYKVHARMTEAQEWLDTMEQIKNP